jgi:DNA processing protein
MATGPEDIYPTRHRTIADRIADTPGSALITDYPPGTAPLAIHFLRRNRIIAGLSEATVLIESKIKGGGMMTARLAGSYNRDVFALPGRIDDLRSQGCNLLINNRTASPITSLEGFMKEVGISCMKSQRKESETERLTRLYKGNLPDDKISQMSRILLLIRKEKGITIDEIAARLDTEYRKITQLTGILETDGIISIDLMQRCFINFRQSL